MSFNKLDEGWEMVMRFGIIIGIIFVAFVVTQGCTTIPLPSNPPTQTTSPSDESNTSFKADWEGKHPEWTPLLKSALETYGKELLASNPTGICGDKMSFYIMMLSTMARFESNHNASVTYTENFRDNEGKLIISRGPLQLSKESCNGYGAKIVDEKELHDPATNFRCAVLIMNKWVTKDGVLAGGSGGAWLGGARYWSVLRAPEKKKVIIGRANEVCR